MAGSDSKLMSLEDAAALVGDDQLLALGGSLLHRCPSAFARAWARSPRRFKVRIAKPSCAYDVDLLIGAERVSQLQAGIVTFEAEFGMAPHFRRAVEQGRIEFLEHA